MRRRLDTCSEIFWRRHQAGAKVSLPDSVDQHPRRGRTMRIDEPLRKTEAVVRRILRKRMQQRGHVWLHLFQWTLPIPAFKNVGCARLASLREGKRLGGIGPVRPDMVEFRIE